MEATFKPVITKVDYRSTFKSDDILTSDRSAGQDIFREDYNAFQILGYVVDLMRKLKFPKSEIDEYRTEATSGGYIYLKHVSSMKVTQILADNDEHIQYDEGTFCNISVK